MVSMHCIEGLSAVLWPRIVCKAIVQDCELSVAELVCKDLCERMFCWQMEIMIVPGCVQNLLIL